MLKTEVSSLASDVASLAQNLHDDSSPLSKNILYIEEFQHETIENLYKFKNESLFTDIFIYIEGVEFPCHKVILCAASSYFKAMFSCDLKESRLGKVYIENISPWTMKRLLDFIYTGKIEINFENVIELFNAACMFQLYKLAEKCTNYIKKNIDLYNCVEINLFASMHNLVDLESDTFKFILENFMELINLKCDDTGTNCSDFVRLSQATFIELIKSDLLNVTREIYVYYALNKWVNHNKTLSHNYEQFFKNIRLNALSREELGYILENDIYVRRNDALRKLVKNVLEKNYSSCMNIKGSDGYMKKRNSLNNSDAARDEILLQKNENLSLFMQTIKNTMNTTNNAVPLSSKSSDNSTNYSSSDSSSASSSASSDILAFSELSLNNLCSLSNKANKSNLRPSTIPREYLCTLSLDQFLFYDFYKSKWDSCAKWPSLVTQKSSLARLLLQKNEMFSTTVELPSSISNSNVSNSSLLPHEASPSLLSSSFTFSSVENLKNQRLNGYSICVVNNILYVLGGHLINNANSNFSEHHQQNLPHDATNLNVPSSSLSNENNHSINQIDLVDTVYRYDPSKNEWSSCKSMIKKRAFHSSISLSDSTANKRHKENYIFVLYGLCYAEEERPLSRQDTFSIPNATNPHLIQCNSIEIYNIETDSWCMLNFDNSLLAHHLFIPYRQHQQNAQNARNQPINQNVLNNFINFQLTQAQSIVSLKNLIYILRENCIHCYEFNSSLSNLTCLPYFRLPLKEVNTFVLGAAVPVKSSQLSTKSPFSWYINEDEDENDDDGENEEESDSEVNHAEQNSGECESGDEDSSHTYTYQKKKEALIYILSPTQGTIYEFYPAKNKLKKLPDLLLKHLPLETQLLKIKSNLYITGGINSKDSNDTSIETYDQKRDEWSVFMNSFENSVSSMIRFEFNQNLELIQNQMIPLRKPFFKLKMPLV